MSDGYDTTTQSVSLEILSINDAPVAIDDAGVTDFETAIALNVLTNDSDVESDPFQVTATGPASNGTVTIGTDGEVTYTPSIGFSGTDTFSYTVSDGVDTDVGQVTITVLDPPNAPPVAADDTTATLENQRVAGSVLANDTDVDTNPLTVYAVEGLTAVVGSAYTLASGAEVTVETDGSFVYDPNGAFGLTSGATATDSFTYTVSDGEGGFDDAVVTIDLTGVGEPPLGTEDEYATDEDTPVAGNVITDDTGNGVDSDPDGDPITVTTVEGRPITDGLFTLVSGAIVTMAPDGSFTYDSSSAQNDLGAGATGTDTFTYTISDGAGGTNKSAVIITLTGLNDAPVAGDDTYGAVETQVLAGNVIEGTLPDGADLDVDGDTLTVSAVNGLAVDVGSQIGLSSGALLLLNADGNFSYDPNGAFAALAYGETGVDSFEYTIDDGQGGSDTALVTLNVSSIAGAPNLVVSDVVFDGGKTDEWLSVSYRVDNVGGSTLRDTGWSDRLYLSTDTVLDENDIFLRELSFSGTLDGGSFYGRTATVKMPGANGVYYLLVDTDADDVLLEADDSNNLGTSPAPATVAPAYFSTLTADRIEAVNGDVIRLSGQAIDFDTAEAAPFEFVTIEAEIGGITRTIDVLTDITGQWSTDFVTLQGQGGTLNLIARHPGNPDENPTPEASVGIYGMGLQEDFVTFEVVNGESGTLNLTLDNFGDLDLTGLTATIEGLPGSWSATPVLGATTLAGDGSLTLDLNASVPNETVYDFADVLVRVKSDQGAVAESNIRIDPVSSLADLVIEQPSIEGYAIRGEQELVSFTIMNEGLEASAPITILLPELDWLGLSSPQIIESLGAGESRDIFVRLTPDEDVPFGSFSGSIAVSEAGGDFETLPFAFFTASDATGTLELNLVDELFYFAEGAPKVDDGRVTVTNAVTGEIVFSSMDVDGMVTINDIPEGFYNVRIDAADHDSYEATIEINPGQTNSINAFMSRQTVKYYWNIEETEIEDRFNVEVEAEFETNVPEPVIVIEPQVFDLAELELVGESSVIELTVTNHGLIGVQDFELTVPSHPFFQVDVPISEFDFIDAKSSITIPVTVTRIADQESLANIEEEATTPFVLSTNNEETGFATNITAAAINPACGFVMGANFVYPCGPFLVAKSAPGLAFANAAICFGATLWDVISSFGLGPSGNVPRTEPRPTLGGVVSDQTSLLNGNIICELPPEFDQGFSAQSASLMAAAAIMAEAYAPSGFASLNTLAATLDDAVLRDAAGNFVDPVAASQASLIAAEGFVELLPVIAEARQILDAAFVRLAEGGGSGSGNQQLSENAALADRIINLWFNQAILAIGDSTWLEADFGDPAVSAFLDFIGTFTDASSDLSLRISDTELAELLAAIAPDAFTSESLVQFTERWNALVDAEVLGVTSLAELPMAFSQNIFSLAEFADLNDELVDQLALAAATDTRALEDFLFETVNDFFADASSGPTDGVCATVRISLSQDAVLTRQAFLAELEIVNELEADLTDIAINLEIRDSLGNLVEQTTFGVTDPFLDGSLTGIDGTGVIAGRTSGSATFTIVPSQLAAPAGEEVYTVSGSLSYNEDGTQVSFPLAPEDITVQPQAELGLDYFMQRNVFSDDPFTEDVVETSQPFAFGLLVNNVGAGDAMNLSITSAQPEIIENEKGLLIDFELLGTEVNGEGVAPTLEADFGDVAAGDAETAVWLMQSSLQGKFVDYEVSFTHENSLGFEELSLITETRIHELVQVVEDDRVGSDALPDFLVNDDWETDPFNLPDTIYTSEMEVLPVALATGESADGAASLADLEVVVTANMTAGYSYASLLDPGSGDYTISSIVRQSDGKVLLDANYWQTDRTFPANGRPDYEDVLHILDYNDVAGTQTYVVTYKTMNIDPTANADAIVANEDSAITFNVLANDTDPEGDPLSIVAVSQGANGTVIVGTGGNVIYTPDGDYTGADSFTYTIADGNGGTALGSVDVTVNEVADPVSSVSIEVGAGNPDDAGFTSSAVLASPEGADGSQEVWFVVSRLGDLSGDVDVTLQLTTSTDGEDYIGTVPTTVMLRSGEDASYFSLDVLGDDVIETDEDIAVSITGTSRADVAVEPSGSTATYTIENDDLASTVSIGVARVGSGDLPATESSFAEGNSGSYDLAFTVTRSGDLSGAVTVALAPIARSMRQT